MKRTFAEYDAIMNTYGKKNIKARHAHSRRVGQR
jgi:hypothetical protein